MMLSRERLSAAQCTYPAMHDVLAYRYFPHADKTWKILEDAIDEIHHQNASGLSFEELYRNAYNMVLHKYGERLYTGLKQTLTRQLKRIAGEIELTKGEPFLKELHQRWEIHTKSIQMVRDILMVSQSDGLPRVNQSIDPPVWFGPVRSQYADAQPLECTLWTVHGSHVCESEPQDSRVHPRLRAMEGPCHQAAQHPGKVEEHSARACRKGEEGRTHQPEPFQADHQGSIFIDMLSLC